MKQPNTWDNAIRTPLSCDSRAITIFWQNRTLIPTSWQKRHQRRKHLQFEVSSVLSNAESCIAIYKMWWNQQSQKGSITLWSHDIENSPSIQRISNKSWPQPIQKALSGIQNLTKRPLDATYWLLQQGLFQSCISITMWKRHHAQSTFLQQSIQRLSSTTGRHNSTTMVWTW